MVLIPALLQGDGKWRQDDPQKLVDQLVYLTQQQIRDPVLKKMEGKGWKARDGKMEGTGCCPLTSTHMSWYINTFLSVSLCLLYSLSLINS